MKYVANFLNFYFAANHSEEDGENEVKFGASSAPAFLLEYAHSLLPGSSHTFFPSRPIWA